MDTRFLLLQVFRFLLLFVFLDRGNTQMESYSQNGFFNDERNVMQQNHLQYSPTTTTYYQNPNFMTSSPYPDFTPTDINPPGAFPFMNVPQLESTTHTFPIPSSPSSSSLIYNDCDLAVWTKSVKEIKDEFENAIRYLQSNEEFHQAVNSSLLGLPLSLVIHFPLVQAYYAISEASNRLQKLRQRLNLFCPDIALKRNAESIYLQSTLFLFSKLQSNWAQWQRFQWIHSYFQKKKLPISLVLTKYPHFFLRMHRIYHDFSLLENARNELIRLNNVHWHLNDEEEWRLNLKKPADDMASYLARVHCLHLDILPIFQSDYYQTSKDEHLLSDAYDQFFAKIFLSYSTYENFFFFYPYFANVQFQSGGLGYSYDLQINGNFTNLC
ncbi:hypothetical protein HMI54_003666 [Coelomomyces lativittatus]|nr:hypothetical protein HMI56_001683 [Coelomomyces lativittatus]KAJ1516388.1 hypothetical protein HMI55_002385 [Coelomomyces lativittatus]KAJ1517865.1 hypothetical protein HMI54_003666 [Coelomomyces lativittatus]